MGTGRWNVLVVAVMASALVAGCTGQEAPPSPTTSPPAEVETPTPTATPESPPRLPPLEDLVITPAGIGSLLVGQPVSRTDMLVFDPDFCVPQDPGDATTNPDGTPIDFGRWVPNYPPENGGDLPFSAHVDDGIVTVIEVRNDMLSTAEGVHIGSSLEELTSAYPSLTPGHLGSISRSLLLTTPEGDMVFEVAIASDYQGYVPDTLINIRIYPPGQHDLKLVAATDDVVGGCL